MPSAAIAKARAGETVRGVIGTRGYQARSAAAHDAWSSSMARTYQGPGVAARSSAVSASRSGAIVMRIPYAASNRHAIAARCSTGSPFDPSILPRQGEVAGTCQTEGEVSDHPCSVSSPSDAFGATSPLRGRIGQLQRPWMSISISVVPPVKAGVQESQPAPPGTLGSRLRGRTGKSFRPPPRHPDESQDPEPLRSAFVTLDPDFRQDDGAWW